MQAASMKAIRNAMRITERWVCFSKPRKAMTRAVVASSMIVPPTINTLRSIF